MGGSGGIRVRKDHDFAIAKVDRVEQHGCPAKFWLKNIRPYHVMAKSNKDCRISGLYPTGDWIFNGL